MVTLPSIVATTLNDGTQSTATVVWNTSFPPFSGTKIGTYVFVGTITPSTGTTNSKGRKAFTSVSVTKAGTLISPIKVN